MTFFVKFTFLALSSIGSLAEIRHRRSLQTETDGSGSGPVKITDTPIGHLVALNNQADDGVKIIGTVANLPDLQSDNEAGVHVHDGYTIVEKDHVGGHLATKDGIDGWKDTKYSVDKQGASQMNFGAAGYSIEDDTPIIQHPVVIHNKAGVRVGIGQIEQLHHMLLVARITDYPTTSNDLSVRGTIAVSSHHHGKDSLTIHGTLSGLEPNAKLGNEANSCGVHIHAGATCQEAKGHFYNNAQTVDPWKSSQFSYKSSEGNIGSNGDGTAIVDLEITSAQLGTALHKVAGLTLVIHDKSGARVGCGVLVPSTGHVVRIQKSPTGTDTGVGPFGTLIVEDSINPKSEPANGQAVKIFGTVAGLQTSTGRSTMHVHEGFNVESPGGHYFGAPAHGSQRGYDGWIKMRYSTNDQGVAHVEAYDDAYDVNYATNPRLPYTLEDTYPVVFRTVVLHDSSFNEVAIGQIGRSHLLVAPKIHTYLGKNDLNLAGTVQANLHHDEISISGTLVGLPDTTCKHDAGVKNSCGVHIHREFSCDTYHADITLYPDYTGPLSPKGKISFQNLGIGGLKISGVVTGLEKDVKYDASTSPTNAAGVHIHAGTTCATADGVGGHYYQGAEDPWTQDIYTYNSGSDGVGRIGISQSVILSKEKFGFEPDAAVGRAVVVHDSTGKRIGCGILQPAGGGHYWNNQGTLPDPWASKSYEGTGNAASIDIRVTEAELGFPIDAVIGRALIVHDQAGSRIGCALLTPTTGKTVTLESYPGYNGQSSTPHGTFVVENSEDNSRVFVKGVAYGLKPNMASAGIHVHAGWFVGPGDNENANTGVGGHLLIGKKDMWQNTKYSTNDQGFAVIDVVGEAHTIEDGEPVAYHPLVLHEDGENAPRSAIGQIGKPGAFYATITKYPGSSYSGVVGGTIVVKARHNTLAMEGTLTGVETNARFDVSSQNSCGVHIHIGATCANALGHFYSGDSDPWIKSTYTYTSDKHGIASFKADLTTTDLGYSTNAISGRAIVVHDTSGNRIGCGILAPIVSGGVVRVSGYPGYVIPEYVSGTSTIFEAGLGLLSALLLMLSVL